MKHPAIEQHAEPAAGGGIPWSAEAECALRGNIRRAWIEMWVGLLSFVFFAGMAFFLRNSWLWLLAVAFISYGVVCLYHLGLFREELGEEMRRGPRGEFFEGSGMLANKPRSTRNLTHFLLHPPSEESFYCPKCERVHAWFNAEWLPNYKREDLVNDATEEEIRSFCGDPGGGRYVILCPCGLGHFKLKQ